MVADVLGWLAAGLTMLTFSMRGMGALRVVGMAANIAFMAYGYAEGLYPVMALHMALLPCNAARYWQIRRLREPARRSPPCPRPGRPWRGGPLPAKTRSTCRRAIMRPTVPARHCGDGDAKTYARARAA